MKTQNFDPIRFEEGNEVQALHWQHRESDVVGRDGVEKITVVMENGQMAGVPWFAVWKNGKIAMKHNGALDGTKLPIAKMTDSHLLNTIRQQRRRAKDGVACWYAGGSDADDMWMDVQYAFGEEALDAMHHDRYLREAKKRKLTLLKETP